MADGMTPDAERRLARLIKSIEYSRGQLKKARDSRVATVKQFVGFHYSEDGAPDKVPVNFLELAIQIYKRHLASSLPKILVNSAYRRNRAVAPLLAMVLEHIFKEIHYDLTQDAVVMDAIVSCGFAKSGVTRAGEVEIDGFLHQTGQPFADPVDLDDWVHDMTVKRWEQISYCGDRYRVDYEKLMSSRDYDTKNPDLSPPEHRGKSEDAQDRAEAIGQGQVFGGQEYRKSMEVWDLWLPDEQRLVTLACGEDGLPMAGRRPLREVDYRGPEIGPYHRLGFTRVPSNTMPLPPLAIIYDLHELANILYRKVGRQAERQKSIGVTRGGADEDGNRVVASIDGEMIRLDDANSTKEMELGGPNAKTLAFLAGIREWLVWFGGNLDTLGGLQAQAPTLGQEEILGSGAIQRIQEMHARNQTFNQEIVESVADYVWYDPMVDVKLSRKIRGTNIEIPVSFNDDIREGDLLDFGLTIEPHSTRARSPEERMRTIGDVMERWIIPLAPQLQAQGLEPDLRELLSLAGRYTGTPELERIIRISDQPPGVMERGRQSPVTTRNTVRRSEASPKAQKSAMLAAATAGESQR